MVVAVFVLNLPVLVLFAGWRHDLDDQDAALLGWSLLPMLLVPFVVWSIARWCRAPFPASAILPSFLACGVGWFAVAMAGSDMLWGDVLADPPSRWLTRGPAGLLGIAFFAGILAPWSAEAVLTRTEAGD